MIPIPRRFYRVLIAVSLAVLLVASQHPSVSPVVEKHLPFLHNISIPGWSGHGDQRNQANALLNGGHTVAIYEYEQFHEEVHGSVLWTFSQFDDIKVSMYRPEWRFGFGMAIASWWATEPDPNAQFWDDLERDSSIRWVFFPTIDFMKRDFADISARLQEAWEARRPEERFTLVGLKHWGTREMGKEVIWWAQRDAIAFLALGDHVAGAVRESLEWGAQHHFKDSPEEQEALRRVRVETYIPAFPPDYEDVDDLGNPVPGGSGAEGLNKALIQSSNFDTGHRAMAPLFDELRDDIIADPELWGYQLDTESGEYVPIDEESPTRFTVKVLGLTGTKWPTELKHVVNMEQYLWYIPFYQRIHSADIVLPAFGTEPYGVNRASSTFGVAATARTPVAVTESDNAAYGWFHPVLARVRDDNMTEIEYVRQVRLGNVPWQSKIEISEQLVQAQYDWTSRNMLTVATLFAVGPEGSAVREKYFGAEAVTVTEVEAESEAEPILGEDIGPIEA